jgi:hypothetical protein
MSDRDKSETSWSWVLPKIENITSLQIDNPEEMFDALLKKSGSNLALDATLRLLKDQIIPLLQWDKGLIIQDFLSDPQVFENNPSQYKNLFLIVDANIAPEVLPLLKEKYPKIAIQYRIYLNQKNKDITNNKIELQKQGEWNIVNQQLKDNANNDWILENKKDVTKTKEDVTKTKEDVTKTKEDVTKTKEDVTKTKEDVTKTKEEINTKHEEIREIVTNIYPTLGNEWQEKLDAFVRNPSNLSILDSAQWDEYREYLKSHPESHEDYLKSVFILQNQVWIRKDLQKSVSESKNPEEQRKYENNIKIFDDWIVKLEWLNIPRSVNNISEEVKGNFPPTQATEAAITQWEKYEKTHTIYRDGTSLYFVNKDDPKDIKQIEIFADRAVLTVMKNGLSLSKTLENPSREEAAKKREKRKLESEWEKMQKSIIEKNNWIKLVPIDNIPQVVKNHSSEFWSYEAARRAYQNAKTPQEKLDSIKYLKQANKWLEDARRDSLTTENMNNPEIIDLESWLAEEKRGLEGLEKELEKYIPHQKQLQQLTDEIGGKKEDKYNTWEQKSKNILWTLTSDQYGYGELGQSYFAMLIEAMRRMNPSSGIWSDWDINVDDDMSIRQQLKSLENLSISKMERYSETGEAKVAWQNIRKGINTPGSELNIIWNNPEKLWKWISENQKINTDTPSRKN